MHHRCCEYGWTLYFKHKLCGFALDGPRHVTIHKDANILECFADGNPTPSFEWFDLASDSPDIPVGNSSILDICGLRPMKDPSVDTQAYQHRFFYQCVASRQDYSSNGTAEFNLVLPLDARRLCGKSKVRLLRTI